MEKLSSDEIVKILGAVGILVGIIGGVIAQIITARIKTAVANAVAPISVAVADVGVKAGAIKASVDGTASRMEASLSTALTENQRLREDKADQKQVAAVLASTIAAPVTEDKKTP